MNIKTRHAILRENHFEINQTGISNAVATISSQSYSSTGTQFALSASESVSGPFRAECIPRKLDEGVASPNTGCEIAPFSVRNMRSSGVGSPLAGDLHLRIASKLASYNLHEHDLACCAHGKTGSSVDMILEAVTPHGST